MRGIVTRLLFDWAALTTKQEFYARAVEQMRAPDWHGHNLDALNDSWVSGDTAEASSAPVPPNKPLQPTSGGNPRRECGTI